MESEEHVEPLVAEEEEGRIEPTALQAMEEEPQEGNTTIEAVEQEDGMQENNEADTEADAAVLEAVEEQAQEQATEEIEAVEEGQAQEETEPAAPLEAVEQEEGVEVVKDNEAEAEADAAVLQAVEEQAQESEEAVVPEGAENEGESAAPQEAMEEEAPVDGDAAGPSAEEVVAPEETTETSANEPPAEEVVEPAPVAAMLSGPDQDVPMVVNAPEDVPEVQEAKEVHIEGQREGEEDDMPPPPPPEQKPEKAARVNAPPAQPQAPAQAHAVGRVPSGNVGEGSVPQRPRSNNMPPPRQSGRVAANRRPVDEYEEQDPGIMLAGEMMPAQFRRGCDNSHINRMTQGSYSRYLLSSDIITEDQLYRSFLGETPVPGYLPFRGDHTADLENRRGNTRASSQRGNRNNQPGRFPGDTLSSTMGGTMSSTIKREMELLDEPMYNELGAQRARRRRDPEHCEDRTVTDQHYYNYKSKAYFVPQDQNPNAVMLQYNHLYDFGDGSRFKSAPGQPSRRNPTAPAPRTYAENKQAAAAMQKAKPPKGTGSVANRRREEIEKGSSSLRTAKAVDVQKLHCSQFRQTRSIEDVVASDPTYVARSTDGIRSVVDSGKMDWSELPSRLQTVMSAERYKKRPTSSSRLYAPYRPPNQATPASVPGAGNTRLQQANADGAVLPPVGGKSNYEVSRISFTKRYEPNATPSAFVDKKGELEPLS